VQAIGLPSLPAQGGRFVVLSLAAMAACLATGGMLAAAGRSVWRVVAAVAVVLLVGWALPRAVTVPGLEATRGDWSSLPGAVCAALAGTCLVAAGLAGQLPRPPVRALATALAVLTVSAPGVWALLVALGPGPAGGEESLAAAHVHGHVHPVVNEQAIQFRAGSGRRGGHYVIAVPAPPRRPPLELELVVAAALVFASGAVRHLGRRSGLAGRPA
jgi:hypothetical protein